MNGTPFRRLPLTMQVLRYLEALREPCHCILLADVLHQPAIKVEPTCVHLVQTGHLRRVRRGYYAITRRGIAASRGVSS